MTRGERILSLTAQVRKIASGIKRTVPKHIQLGDLVGEAWLGAIWAVDHWDPRRGSTLGTYAKKRIRGAILDYLRQLDFLSRDGRKAYKREVAASLLAGRMPPPPPRVVGLDVRLKNDDNYTELEIPDISAGVRIRRSDAASDLARLRVAAHLTPREGAVLDELLRDRTQAEMFRGLGVNESRVSQLRTRALRKLRAVA